MGIPDYATHFVHGYGHQNPIPGLHNSQTFGAACADNFGKTTTRSRLVLEMDFKTAELKPLQALVVSDLAVRVHDNLNVVFIEDPSLNEVATLTP